MSILDLHALVGEYPIPQLAQEFDHVFDHKDDDDVAFLKWYRLMALVSHWNLFGEMERNHKSNISSQVSRSLG